jgi:hypothetical protein
MKSAVIYITLILFLTGCAGGAQPTLIDKGPVPTVGKPTGSITPTPEPGETVIILEQNGGIAGVHKVWTIYSDGRVLSGDQAGQSLQKDQVKTLLADIEKLGFYKMQADYSENSVCNDCFIYSVTITSEVQSRTVTGVEGDINTPAEFLQIVEMINNLVNP